MTSIQSIRLRSREDPLAIDEPPRTKPKVTLATLDLEINMI
ncbi:MAG: hypothetical protein ACK5OC_14365 [Pirellula sp.]